jgi:5'-deoxynucleotidase YfbR-like HD superfamily hydrolase
MQKVQNNNEYSRQILDLVSGFQIKAQNIRRYEGNPYVSGDNIAEHLLRLARLCISIGPDLKKEFPDDPQIIENLLVTLLVHDDDEVIDGFDIPTSMKIHNAKDQEEIERFNHSISSLNDETKKYLGDAFGSFRRKDTLVAKIAKALDNIAGNQLVIEQKIGLINPDQARFAIEYVEKVRGVSKTTDSLINAQIQQIIEFREYMLDNPDELKRLPEKTKELLKIDVMKHVLDRSKINVPLEKL